LGQKYFIREALQDYKFDEKLVFFNLLTYLVLDQGLYFGVKFEDKAVAILSSILLQEIGLNEDVKKDIQKGLNLYNESDNVAFTEINKRLTGLMK